MKKRWTRKATGGRLTRIHADRLTKHVKKSTLPKWFVRNCRRLDLDPWIIDTWITDVPVYEDGRGFAFRAWLEEGRIGCLMWMSERTPQACEAVLREAKASRAAGLYLPGTGHVPDFPVGEFDLMVEIPIVELRGDNLRCVLFDVLRPQFSESSEAALPIRIEFEPFQGWDNGGIYSLYRKTKVPLIQPDDHFRKEPVPRYVSVREPPETSKILCADRRVKVWESGEGVRLAFDKPIVMFASNEFRNEGTRFGLGAREYRESNIKAWDWPDTYLEVEDFDWPYGPYVTLFDVERNKVPFFSYDRLDGKDEEEGYTRFRLPANIRIIRGIYLPAPDLERDRNRWRASRWRGISRPSDEEYETLYGKFSIENVAARVIQCAWRRVSCNPYHVVGDRVLRARAASHVAAA